MLSSKDYVQSGHFLMRIGNVQSGEITLSDPKYVGLPANGQLDRFELTAGDILVSLTGYVGRVAVAFEEHLPAALNQRVARITVSRNLKLRENFCSISSGLIGSATHWSPQVTVQRNRMFPQETFWALRSRSPQLPNNNASSPSSTKFFWHRHGPRHRRAKPPKRPRSLRKRAQFCRWRYGSAG